MSDTPMEQERRQYLPQYAEQMQDEISLIDLYRMLVDGKKILFATLAIVVALSVVYLLLASKVYQVTAMLLEPSADQLVLTNRTVVNPNLDGSNSKALFLPKKIFEEYKVAVKGSKTWNLFIEAYPKYFIENAAIDSNEATDSFVESIHNPLVISEDKEYPGPHILLEYDTSNREQSDEVLTQYLAFTKEQLVQAQIKLHKQQVEQKIAALQFKIKTSRTQEKVKRQDSIVRLESDLAIAKKLGIKDNRMMALQNTTSLTVVASNMDIPRYMRGTKVLAAELDALKNRSSDDAFIKGLREWQQEVDRLRLIKYLPEQFQPFILDGAINKPKSPIKPKKRLVLALAIVLGLFVGVFAVFFFEFTKKAAQSKP